MLASALALFSPQAASAATKVLGYDRGAHGVTPGAGRMGTVAMLDGSLGFCIDPVGEVPSSATSYAGQPTSIVGTTRATWPNHNDTRSMDNTDVT